MWRRSQHGQAAGQPSRVGCRQRLPGYARWVRLRRGVRRGAEVPRNAAVRGSADQQQPGAGVRRAARAGDAAVVLSRGYLLIRAEAKPLSMYDAMPGRTAPVRMNHAVVAERTAEADRPRGGLGFCRSAVSRPDGRTAAAARPDRSGCAARCGRKTAGAALGAARYFVVVLAASGLSWSIHLWTGAVFLAGVVGWLLALLATLPSASTSRAWLKGPRTLRGRIVPSEPPIWGSEPRLARPNFV